MRFKYLFFCLLISVLNSALMAQSDYVWLSTGKVKARITPTGIHRNAQGGFFLESNIPGQPAKNLLSHLGPWAGGLDPGANLLVAIETTAPLNSDWKSGFRGIPNSGKLWTVSDSQIVAHLSDFSDNGIIDNPIAEIFAWPGNGNPFSESYNGFSIDSISPPILAPFMDYDWDGIYDPSKGDVPLKRYGFEYSLPINTLIYSPFFDNLESNPINKTTGLDFYMLAFTLGCNENSLTNNSIFFEYGGLLNTSSDRIDSLHIGIFADIDIGSANDDYIGSIKKGYNKEIFYSYNSDTLVDMLLGANPPSVAIMPISRPYDYDADLIPLASFMPLFSTSVPQGALSPSAPHEYFNYLTGTWRDGTTITSNGIGYNPGMSSPPLKMAFPDPPNDINGWSELSENNLEANRRFIASFGPMTIKPSNYSVRPLVFSLTVSDKFGLTQQLEQLAERRELLGDLFDWCNDCPLEALCSMPSTVQDLAYMTAAFPNPTSQFITLKTPGININKIFLRNALFQNVTIDPPKFIQENEIQVSLKNLPAGVYFLQWFSKDGRYGCEKVVKN